MRDGRGNVLLATVAFGTFVLLMVCAIEVRSLLADSAYGAAKRNARQDARLIADLGLAGALSDGRLTDGEGRMAASEVRAAARSHGLARLMAWTPSGKIVFAAGAPAKAPKTGPSGVVRTAFRSGETEAAHARGAGVGDTIEAAVPLRTPRGAFVADFHFSRRGVEPDVAGAKRRLLVFGAIAALCFYLGILPLLARLARRLPSPVHPRHRAALAELRRALEDGELCVHYQPQVDIVTGAPIGVEALVRWQHPQRGLLGPPAFLLDAERSPATRSALTRRVLDLAVGDCARWTREGRELPVAVNIAASLLIDGSIVGSVAEALASHSLDAHLLTVEITETAIMQATDAASVVGELRNLGVAVSIDDFGTGHSSLARLRSVPLDELKIDRAFVRTIAADDRDLAIVQLIADLGAGFGLRVVAEGVEDDHTVTLLRSVGCAAAQGYLFAPPLPERDLLAWMDERTEALGSAAHGSRDVR